MYLISTYLTFIISIIFHFIQDLLFDSDWFLFNLIEFEFLYLCSTVFVSLYAYFYFINPTIIVHHLEPFEQFSFLTNFSYHNISKFNY